jgi:hypothetical protein
MLADRSRSYTELENALCKIFGCCIMQSVGLAVEGEERTKSKERRRMVGVGDNVF